MARGRGDVPIGQHDKAAGDREDQDNNEDNRYLSHVPTRLAMAAPAAPVGEKAARYASTPPGVPGGRAVRDAEQHGKNPDPAEGASGSASNGFRAKPHDCSGRVDGRGQDQYRPP